MATIYSQEFFQNLFAFRYHFHIYGHKCLHICGYYTATLYKLVYLGYILYKMNDHVANANRTIVQNSCGFQ